MTQTHAKISTIFHNTLLLTDKTNNICFPKSTLCNRTNTTPNKNTEPKRGNQLACECSSDSNQCAQSNHTTNPCVMMMEKQTDERTPKVLPNAQSPNFPNLSYFKTLNLISVFSYF